MKICDRCGCEVGKLETLKEEYESMEVCESCKAELEKRLRSAFERYSGYLNRRKAREFESWKSEIGSMSIRSRRFMEFIFRVVSLLAEKSP